MIGAFVAAGFYKLFKLLGYESANPGQDSGSEVIGLLYRDEESALAANHGEAKPMPKKTEHPVVTIREMHRGESAEGEPSREVNGNQKRD
jgi:aquaporin related protein